MIHRYHFQPKGPRTNMVCHDCKCEIGGFSNSYGEFISYGNGFYKCEECFAKDPELRNFQECEVYSRVVGYLRPVSQWNKGKQAEFGDRKEYLESVQDV